MSTATNKRHVFHSAYPKLLRWAHRAAKESGIYILAMDAEAGERWTVYDRASGNVLLDYFPSSRRWTFGRDHGSCSNVNEMLKLARCRVARMSRA